MASEHEFFGFPSSLLINFGFNMKQLYGGFTRKTPFYFNTIFADVRIDKCGNIYRQNIGIEFSFGEFKLKYACRFLVVGEGKSQRIRVEFKSRHEIENKCGLTGVIHPGPFSNEPNFIIFDSYDEMEKYLFEFIKSNRTSDDLVQYCSYKLQTKLWVAACQNSRWFHQDVSFFMNNVKKWISKLQQKEEGAILTQLLESALDKNILCLVFDEDLFQKSGNYVRLGSVSGSLTLCNFNLESRDASCERVFKEDFPAFFSSKGASLMKLS